ncbi:hypothetical protein PAPYR_4816 [Paratrimastix pyriformis]|uniref:Uncharacterized protein n=1 Tax=Paratrimastix pyriformis TaxID=342808 RepID=A0ABQ8ULG4_9EUKA|nr:hypothetical protein PAPYR_4816 [Paratrimastix pyriformis]
MLSLSHAIRTKIRGTLRELSLVVLPDPAELITTDALAALVGPCRSLHKLSFPEGWGRGTDQKGAVTDESGPHDVCDDGWVDEAFGGHTQLAVLEQLPSPLPEPAVERIFRHLPGLVELTTSQRLAMSTRLLAALARSCPGLQVLRCSLPDRRAGPASLTALAPLSGVLKELDLRGGGWWSPEVALTALVGSLSAVTSLKLLRCPPAALEPVASHLTALELISPLSEEDLPGPWLCRLEVLSLGLSPATPTAPLVRLLAANQATLRSLTLVLNETDPLSLVASLRALPHLACLKVAVRGACCPLSNLLPPDLVDRLESLDIGPSNVVVPDPVRIASSRLRELRLHVSMPSASGLALCCPALVELDLIKVAPGGHLTLQCPRLRVLRASAALHLDGAAPMPDLEVADFFGEKTFYLVSGEPLVDPAWLLAGASPRLRELSHVRLTRPDLLARLCACGSLVRLQRLHLDLTRLPNPLVLRLPGQLERLDLSVIVSGIRQELVAPLNLQLDAPGLLDLSLAIMNTDTLPPHVRVRLRNCPHLFRLTLKSPAIALLSLQVADEAVADELRELFIEGHLEAASLLGLLTRHGACLRSLVGTRAVNEEDWPQLMVALSGLPRLTSLYLNAAGVCSPLSLACPQLRRLVLRELPGEAKVVLACPLLERLLGDIRDRSRQVELALPAPNLRF